jgi:hypothetical protein
MTGRLRPLPTSMQFVSLLAYPSSAPKPKVQQPEIEDRHRLYLHENKPGFDLHAYGWFTEEELEEQDQAYYDYPVDPKGGEEKKNLIFPGMGHSPFSEYSQTGTLQHKPGVCGCPDCSWLWEHIGRAVFEAMYAQPNFTKTFYSGYLKEAWM